MDFSPNTNTKLEKYEQKKKILPNLTVSQREQIHLLHNQNFKPAKIAEALGCCLKTVYNTLKKIKESGNYFEKPRSGRPPKVTKEVESRILDLSESNRKLTAPSITAKIKEEMDVEITDRLTAAVLARNGLHGRVAVKKPLLRDANKQKRLQFALAHADWTVEQWKKVFFTDESKFNVFGTHRVQWCRKRDGEELRADTVHSTVKHGGGGVMVWGGIGNGKVGKLHRIKGIMDQYVYHNILVRHAIPSACRIMMPGWIYQEDNDPKHTSKLCRNYLINKAEREGFTIMEWPSQSPDLNPIELLWEEIDRRVRKLHPTSEEDLWQKLQQVWDNIEPECVEKLVARMPALMKMVIKQEGGYFKEKGVSNRIKALEAQG